MPYREALRQFQRHYLSVMFSVYDYNVGDVARGMGVNRTTLFRMLRRCGLSKPVRVDVSQLKRGVTQHVGIR